MASREMMQGDCRVCHWRFDVMALPMDLKAAAAIAGACRCLMCGADNVELSPRGRVLTGAEWRHKERLIAEAAQQKRNAVNLAPPARVPFDPLAAYARPGAPEPRGEAPGAACTNLAEGKAPGETPACGLRDVGDGTSGT